MRTPVVLSVACVWTCACAGSATVPPTAPPAPTPPTKPSAACASPEHRQLDFWIGDWDLAVRARARPTDAWGEAGGSQHVEAILGGCAIAESFSADGPATPWAGRSVSSWQPTLGTWRQTWVDDSGGYLAFTGTLEHGVMTLYGEPITGANPRVQMRMVFDHVTADALHWEWQRSPDDWATTQVLMEIEYTRRK